MPEQSSFYPCAQSCRFLPNWRPFTKVEETTGASFYHDRGYMRFSFEGNEYLLGISPNNLLLGFLGNPASPDSQADLLLLQLPQETAPRLFKRASVPSNEVARIVQALTPPPPSGSLTFPAPAFRYATS